VRDQGRYIAEVNLNENAPWRFRYGFAVANKRQTTDRDLGVTADFSYGNLFGRGVTLGTSAKATSAERDGRIYASFPVFMGRDVTTSATVFRTRDLSVPESITDLWGLTIQQQWRLRNLYVLSYDYSYKRNHTFVRGFDPDNPFDFNLIFPIARFNGTLSRDSRDDILNATKGTFLSSSTEIAPPGVGSSIRFIKNYTQYLKFRPIWGNKVWASAVRVGLASGFGGQELIPTERFTAGGPTSVRGFKQDQLSLNPGDAVFSFTQEIRSPLFWRFGGAAFFDAGNVYPKVGNLNPFKLRYSPGFGLRVETPFVLIRMDLGFNLSPRADEPRHRFSFGIGQAF
jgi:outer membrane protein assembly factor BamA